MAIYGAFVIVITIIYFVRGERVVWSDAVIGALMFPVGVRLYRRLRHEDPWNPPPYVPEPLITELKIESRN